MNTYQFAHHIKDLGFRVFVARSGHYGIITDQEGSRVLSFSFMDGGSLSGNYGPPTITCGTGWRIEGTPYELKTAGDVMQALYAHPPAYCCGRSDGWKYYTTLEQHLKTYQASSHYWEV